MTSNKKRQIINKQLVIFLSIFALILFSGHFYLFTRISHYLELSHNARSVFSVALVSISLLTLVAMPLSSIVPRKMAKLMSWIVYPWMGIGFLLVTMLLAADLLWLLFKVVLPTAILAQPHFQYYYGITILSITGLLAAYAFLKALPRLGCLFSI